MHSWHLAHTKIRQDHIALENLQRQGYECYLPTFQAEKLRGGKLQMVSEPLFPRYLFIRLGDDLQSQSWAPIRSTLGVSRLVRFGQTPARVDDALVAAIQARCDAGELQRRHFEPGESLVVAAGPFVGLEAIYQMPDGEERVMVLLNILSKPVQLSLPPAQLKKIR